MAEHASVIRVSHFEPSPGKRDDLRARLVLAHLEDPAAALAQMTLVVGAEGRVLLIEDTGAPTSSTPATAEQALTDSSTDVRKP